MKRIFTAVLAGVFMLAGSAQAQDPEGTLNGVWMRYGGARLYYDGLVRPIQINLNGASWRDPALTMLPPLNAPEIKPVRRTARKASAPASVEKKETSAPAAPSAVTPPAQSGAALTPPAPAAGSNGVKTAPAKPAAATAGSKATPAKATSETSPFVEPAAAATASPQAASPRPAATPGGPASGVPAGAMPGALDVTPRK